jgi:hypothetical protein
VPAVSRSARLSAQYNQSQQAGDLTVRLEKPESGNDTFNLVMSPVEWREIHALAKFGQAAAAYDCTAPYVLQVLKYDASQPEEILADREMQAALAALDRMAARIPPDGGGSGNITFALPKEDMRQFLVILNMAAAAEKQAVLVHSSAPEKFPHVFPDIEVDCKYYARAFEDLLMALHKDQPLSITRPPSYMEIKKG